MTTHYADTSALVKLVAEEAESAALIDWIRAEERTIITCDLTRTELLRAVLRSAPQVATRARSVLTGAVILALSSTDFDSAGRLGPASLRSLDALHLTAALLVMDELDSVLTYDDRMAAAARDLGLLVESPGR